jgi:chemotaxis protein MotB
MPAERLVAVGYAENRPIEQGDSPEALARNRRVTLLILSDSAKAAQGLASPEARVAAAQDATPAANDAIGR